MANPDARFGLKPVRHLNGNPWNGGTMRCYIPAAYDTAAMFVGDPVVLEPLAASRVAGIKCPQVQRAAGTTTTYIFGVITSFEPDQDDLSLKYRVNSTARYCNVCVDPDVIYWIRDNADAYGDEDDIGGNADGIFTHGGSTTTGLSGFELDQSSIGEDAADAFFIIGVADVEDNLFNCTSDTNTIWEVLINMHQLRATGDASGALGVVGA